jgi:hypothetical protein
MSWSCACCVHGGGQGPSLSHQDPTEHRGSKCSTEMAQATVTWESPGDNEEEALGGSGFLMVTPCDITPGIHICHVPGTTWSTQLLKSPQKPVR